MILYKAVDNRRQGLLQAFRIRVLFSKHLSIIQHISHEGIAMINDWPFPQGACLQYIWDHRHSNVWALVVKFGEGLRFGILQKLSGNVYIAESRIFWIIRILTYYSVPVITISALADNTDVNGSLSAVFQTQIPFISCPCSWFPAWFYIVCSFSDTSNSSILRKVFNSSCFTLLSLPASKSLMKVLDLTFSLLPVTFLPHLLP